MPLHFCLHIQGHHGQFLAVKTSTVAATSSAAAAFYSAKSRQSLGLAAVAALILF